MKGKIFNKQKGSTLVIVLIIMIFISFLLIAMNALFTGNMKNIGNEAKSKIMYYNAVSGIHIAESAVFATIGTDQEKILKDMQSNHKLKLKDTITKTQIPDLGDDIEIDIVISYSDKGNYKTKNKIKIESIAKNKRTKGQFKLTKYLDPKGINTNFE